LPGLVKNQAFCLPQFNNLFDYFQNSISLKCYAELVSVSHETLKQVQGDSEQGQTCPWSVIASKAKQSLFLTASLLALLVITSVFIDLT